MTALLDPLIEFSPERWARARSVLSGESPKGVSLTAAARAAGVTRATLNAWVRRSEQKIETDDPLVHEIAEVVNARDELQAGTLEDVAWRRATVGVRKKVFYRGEEVGLTTPIADNRLLMRMLEVREKRYAPKIPGEAPPADGNEIYQRFLAGLRLDQAKAEAIELKPEDFTVVPTTAPPSQNKEMVGVQH